MSNIWMEIEEESSQLSGFLSLQREAIQQWGELLSRGPLPLCLDVPQLGGEAHCQAECVALKPDSLLLAAKWLL